jgi:hypothetical protein
MKKLLSILSIMTLSAMLFAQAPQSFSYQTVIRDANWQPISNQSVSIKIEIIEDAVNGFVVHEESHSATTNDIGLVNLAIGSVITQGSQFQNINWSQHTHFIRVSVDVSGGLNYFVMGTTQLRSVPYALYAETSGSSTGPQGIAGVDGIDGIDGAPGVDGINGIDGLPGADGQDGVDGLPGADGQDGAPGIQGVAGATGNPGTNGVNGTNGTNGAQGLPGNDGIDGQDGAPGQDGSVGATGSQGIQGVPGNDGQDGNDGAQGVDGTNGTNGLPGADGTNGVDGADGIDGAQGPIGLPGSDGADGTDGIDGTNGVDGTNGADGIDAVVDYDSLANIISIDSTFITNSNTIIHGSQTMFSDSTFIVPDGITTLYISLNGAAGGDGQDSEATWANTLYYINGCQGGAAMSANIIVNCNPGDTIIVNFGNAGVTLPNQVVAYNSSASSPGTSGGNLQFLINSVNMLNISGGVGGQGISYGSINGNSNQYACQTSAGADGAISYQSGYSSYPIFVVSSNLIMDASQNQATIKY